MKRRKLVSLSAIVLMAYVLLRVAHLYPRWDKAGPEATLSWDAYGYYLYLPAYFIYEDLGELGFTDSLFQQYRPAGDFHHAIPQADGRQVLKYPIGMALVHLPWFGIAHLHASYRDAYPADGFSWPYQFWVAIGGLFYAVLGLWLVRKILLRFFSDLSTAIVLGIIVLGTNYLNYTAIDGAMPHNVLFSLNALILWLSIRWHEQPQWRLALGIGLSIGLATIIRPTELMLMLVPLLWGLRAPDSLRLAGSSIPQRRKALLAIGLALVLILGSAQVLKISPIVPGLVLLGLAFGWLFRHSLWQRAQFFWQQRHQVLTVALGLVIMGSIQLAYWKYASGSFIYNSYQGNADAQFEWLHPHVWDGLFSFRKGWLIYTPIMLFAWLGLVPLYRQQQQAFWPILIYLTLTLYVVFSWHFWSYGGSFGARPLVQVYALLALPLAAWVQYMLSRRWLAIVCGIFMLLCVDLNLVMHWQAHAKDGGWEAEYMTQAYFWKIFGSTNPDKADKIFLDVKRELSSTAGMQIHSLYANGFEEDSIPGRTQAHVKSGSWAFQLDGQQQFSPAYEVSLGELKPHPKAWVRVSAQVFFTQIQWDRWQMTQLITQFIRDGKPYKATGARIHQTMDPWEWKHFSYEMRVPRNYRDTDQLKVYLWNAGSQTALYVDDLAVELIEPEE